MNQPCNGDGSCLYNDRNEDDEYNSTYREKEEDKFIIKEGDNKDYKNKVKMIWASTYGHFTAILKFNDEIDENWDKYSSDIFWPFHGFLSENYPLF